MSSWIRIEHAEESFEELHHIKPMIYRLCSSGKFGETLPSNLNQVKLIFNGKEIILTEKLEKGLTKEATLEESGKEILVFKVHYDAERKAAEILRS